METKRAVFLLVSVVSILVGSTWKSSASDADLNELTPQERRQAIRDSIEASRKEREKLIMRSARVYQPGPRGAELDRSSLKLDDAPFGYAAQVYSKLTHKEVMVSMGAAILSISIDVSDCTSREAISKLEDAFEKLGVRITKIGKSTVALTDVND